MGAGIYSTGIYIKTRSIENPLNWIPPLTEQQFGKFYSRREFYRIQRRIY